MSTVGDGSEFGELPDTVAVLALASGGLAGRDQAGSGGEVTIAVGHAEEWRAALARAGAEQEQVGT
ncbi:MAG: hypothetical protein HOQ07_06605 [Sinomonas sp.]|nr:hypothetical protein [Sinomonas sp.]